MVMSLLVEVQAVDIADARIQAATRSVLELCSEMSQEPVNLLWPLLTAGSCCITEEDRNWVRRLFSTSKDEYCKDLEIAVSSRTGIDFIAGSGRLVDADRVRIFCCMNSGHASTVGSRLHLGQL